MKGISVKAMLALVLLLAFVGPVFAQSADRFPRPEFAKGYQEPSMRNQPGPRSVIMEWVDVGILVLALSAAR